MQLDELMSKLGNPGCYQIFIFLLLAFNYIPLVFNHIIMAFIGFVPPHQCISRSIESLQTLNSTLHQNISSDMSTTNLPMYQANYGKCQTTYSGIQFGNYDNKTVYCSKDSGGTWKYEVDEGETTIVTEWNLVCGEVSLSKLATTIYFIGVMAGGLIFGYLADRFGRKPIMLACLYLPVAIGIGISFAHSYTMFVILRFLQGFFMQGLQTSTYVLVMELFLPQYRSTAGALLECYWGATVMMMAGLAYLLQSWHYLQLAISIPSVLAIAYICLVPESLRWLIMKNRMDDAEQLAIKYAQYNKCQFPLSTWEAVKLQVEARLGETTRQYSNLDMIKTPKLRKRSCILFYIWFACAVNYYGLTFQITSFAGNKYLNFFISGFVEFIAYCIAIYVIKRFGRRKPLSVYFLISSITCIMAAFIPPIITESGIDLTKISTGLAIAGKFGMGGVFSVMFLYTSELYPTVIRNIGMGSCAFWARLGGVVAPQVVGLGEMTHHWVPLVLFGVTALGGGILTLFLPETLGRKLPDTIEDAETMFLSISDDEGKTFPINQDVLLNEKTEL